MKQSRHGPFLVLFEGKSPGKKLKKKDNFAEEER